MDRKSHHTPLGLPTEPKPNPRINNPFTVSVVNCAKTVENSIFAQKNIFLERLRMSLKIKNCIPRTPKETQEIASSFRPHRCQSEASTAPGLRASGIIQNNAKNATMKGFAD